jgi:hypothetical protein
MGSPFLGGGKMTTLNDIKASWQKVMDSLKSQNDFLNEHQGSRWGPYDLQTVTDAGVEKSNPENSLVIDNQIADLAAEFDEMIQMSVPGKTINLDDYMFRIFDIKSLLKEEKSQFIFPRFFDTLDSRFKDMIENSERLLDEFENTAIDNRTKSFLSGKA